jgi:N-acetylmuramic acid 6-phosphate etherase
MTAGGTEARPLVGCAYFGVRIPRHVRRDMEDLARRGFGGVLHTFSENDLAYYRDTMREIVDMSHDLGLEVQMNPWGLGRTFGGEAESRFVNNNPDACQVLDDGRRVAAACLNHPRYRAFCREWADAALEAGADLVFWDEPHWVVPVHVGVDDPQRERWGCRCDECRSRYDGEMPTELTDEVLAFREASLRDFLGEMVAHVRARRGRSTICLLPADEGTWGVRDWDAVAALPGLDVFATDPYWQDVAGPAEAFVSRYAEKLAASCAGAGVTAELWLPTFRLARADIPDFEAAVGAARRAGIGRIWLWGYEGCAHMTHLATPESLDVWEAACGLLVQPAGTLADLDARATRELVDAMNREDQSVAGVVAGAADAIADAIDAIVPRLAAGGALVYVGAGTSGGLAALDADECEATFSVNCVRAVVVPEGSGEDDRERGARTVAARGGDVVVGVSASGSTPFVLGAIEAARSAGAHTIAVVSTPGSALARACAQEIRVVVGPEFVSGSTRLKAGTAQKLVLNMLSTISMIRLGKTFGNLMVDVNATNAKLRERVRAIVRTATGAPAERADAALAAAGGSAKIAIVSLLAGLDADSARARLESASDNVRAAVDGT